MCLAHLHALDPAPDEIRIAVDGANSAVVHAAARVTNRIVTLPQQSGPAAARNLAASGSSADVLLFVDADVAVPRDLVARVAAAFSDDPTLDALVGSYDAAPTAPNLLSQYKNLQHHYTHQHASEDAQTFWGACGAIRRQIFESLDGFDAERYRHPSVEDIELGYRLHAAGGRIRLDPSIQVTHLKTWRAWDLLRTEVLRRAIPWSRLMLERGELQSDLGVGAAGRARVGAAWVLTLSAPAALRSRQARRIAAAAVLALVGLDWQLARFLSAHLSPTRLAASLAWHWFAHLYSGVGFAWAVGERLWGATQSTSGRRSG